MSLAHATSRLAARTALVGACLWCKPVNAQSADLAPAAATTTVMTVTGESLRGEVLRFDLHDRLVFRNHENGAQHTITADDVVSLQVRSTTRRLPHPAVMLHLAGGNRLAGTVAGSDNDVLTVRNPSLGAPVHVALTDVEALLTAAAHRTDRQNATRNFLAQTAGEYDRVLLANGDILHGLIAALDERGLQIEVNGTMRGLTYDTVVAASLIAGQPPGVDGLRARISLDDGTLLTAPRLLWEPHKGLCVDYRDERLCLQPQRVTNIEILGGRWQWLTALCPVSVEHTAMMSVDWEHQINRSVIGTALRVGDRPFDHGIGVHSRSSLTYELKGDYREFVTHCGLDRTAGPLASVEVVIRVDGRNVYRETLRSPSALHGPLRIPVTGCRTLELLVDFADNGAIQDRFDWIQPGLIR